LIELPKVARAPFIESFQLAHTSFKASDIALDFPADLVLSWIYLYLNVLFFNLLNFV